MFWGQACSGFAEWNGFIPIHPFFTITFILFGSFGTCGSANVGESFFTIKIPVLKKAI